MARRFEWLVEIAPGADPAGDPADMTWIDISDRRRVREPIVIGVGQPDEFGQPPPSSCSMLLDNTGGPFVTRNPLGPWYPDLRRNTPLRVRVRRVADTFERTASAQWSPADTGQAWTAAGGAAGDFDIAAGVGTHTVADTNTERYCTAASLRDCEQLVSFATDKLAVTAGMSAGVVFRFIDESNFYLCRATLNADQTVTSAILQMVGGVFTSIDSATAAATHAIGSYLKIRARISGSNIRMRTWEAADAEPSTWDVDVDDDSLTAAGGVGMRTIRNGGNTSGTTVFSFDDYSVFVDRFIGGVPAWPPRWDKSGQDRTVPIVAKGVLQQLSQGDSEVKSGLRRYWEVTEPLPLAYWPLEDPDGSLFAASGLPSGQPMAISGSSTGVLGVKFRQGIGRVVPTYVGFPVIPIASYDMVSLGAGGSLYGSIPAGTSSPVHWTVQFLGRTWAFDHGSDIVMVRWNTPGGSFVRWEVISRSSDGRIDLVGYNSAGAATTLLTSFPSLAPVDIHQYHILVQQNGANVDSLMRISRVLPTTVSGVQVTDSRAGTLTWPTGIYGNPNQVVIDADPIVGSETLLNDLVIGHLGAWEGTAPRGDALGYPGPWSGYPGELASDRIERLCAEQGVPVTITAGDSEPLGSQGIGAFVDLMREAAKADGGILHDGGPGLAYIPRSARYNGVTALTIDFEQGQVDDPPEPTDDDQALRNDWTISRTNGSSARYVDEAHVAAEGRYDDAATINVETDDVLAHHAAWRVHLGTWPEMRWPALSWNFAHSPELIDAWLACGISSRVEAVNQSDSSGDPIDLLIEGYTEIGNTDTWEVYANHSPAGPWKVAVLDNDRADTAASELAEAIDDDDTSFDVLTSQGPLWTTDDAEFPFDVVVGGERMTVTDIAASTVVFGGVGAVDHDVNASVQPVLPSHAAGQLLVVFAAIRNSGAGIPQVPTNTTGWQRLPIFTATSNAQVFAKIATSSAETDPIVTFTGGVANADTSAQAIRLNGKWYDLDRVVLRAANSLNASAQDIAYPGLVVEADNCIVIYFGWKQDDWTSVSSPGTEFGEPDTTTGDDQGIVWSRQIQTTRAPISPGVFTVTGGAAAISRAAVAALRPPAQEFTVTRAVNGVVKSHAAGADVRLYQPMILAK